MWARGWREALWERMERERAPWDLVIVGGGITGAGILREATRAGLRALLVERRDFAWGASSRSSKLVHGGLRYLKQGDVRLMWTAIHERERLLRAAPGLVTPLTFLVPTYAGVRPGRWSYAAALGLYDLVSRRWEHPHSGRQEVALRAPHLARAGLSGGFRYGDAQTDDARLVLRVLGEGVAAGGAALNYAAVTALLRRDGQVSGVRVRDEESGRELDVRAQAVVNATGAWADGLRGQVGGAARLRPLRGSHLLFPAWRLPVAQAIGLFHPQDGRPIFVLPWEGATLVGTTDVDHDRPLDEEPRITPAEAAYLFAALDAYFPALDLRPADAIAAYAGIRPVIASGKADPSAEPRDEAVWEERGLLTITGGKLTTFRQSALLALRHLRDRLPELALLEDDCSPLDAVEGPNGVDGLPAGGAEQTKGRAAGLDMEALARLLGRYGAETAALLAAARPGELRPIPGTPMRWAELRWAGRAGGVIHLDDLLLRRVRLGLLLPEGGMRLLPAIRAICQGELGWTDAHWEAEEARYRALWRARYRVPDLPKLSELSLARATLVGTLPRRTARASGRLAALGLAALVGGALMLLLWRAERRRVVGAGAGALESCVRAGQVRERELAAHALPRGRDFSRGRSHATRFRSADGGTVMSSGAIR